MKPCVIRKPAKTNIIYTGAFVNTNLTKEYSSNLPNKFGHHMTVSFKPSDLNVPVGENTDLKIIGRLTTDKVDVLIIDNELSTNEFPHITLATAEGVKPFASNTEIKNNQDKIVPLDTTINATYGYFDGKNDVTKIPTGTIQVTAPNGKPSKLFNDLNDFLGNEELALKAWARTYTKEFKQWFKNSKVVDENGEPKFVFLDKANTDPTVFAFSDKQSTDPFFLSIKKPQEQDTKTDTISSDRDGIITQDGSYIISNPGQAQSLYGEQDQDEYADFEDDALYDVGQEGQEDIVDFKTVGTKFEHYRQFKKDQIIELRNRLKKIKKVKEDLRNAGLHIKKNKKQFVEFSKLQEEVSSREKLLDEEVRILEQNSTLYSIQDIARTDFARADFLLAKNVLNPSEIKELIELLNFYSEMKPDIKVKHPLFTKEQMFDKQGKEKYDIIPKEVFGYMSELDKQVSKRQNEFDEKKKILITRIINHNRKVKNLGHEYTYEEIVAAEEGIADLGWIDKNLMDMTMGIFTDNGIVPEVAFSYLQESQDAKLQEAAGMGKELDSLQKGVEEELKKQGQSIKIPGAPGVSYDMFKQIDELGFETGKIVDRFTPEFSEEKNLMSSKFKEKLNDARNTSDFQKRQSLFRKAYNYKRDWERQNTIQFKIGSIEKIFNNPDFAEFKDYFDKSQSKQHEQELKEVLSSKAYNEKVDEQEKLLYRYLAERKAQKEMLGVEKFLKWEKLNNPFISNQYHYNNDNSNFNVNSIPNGSYNVSVPRKYDVKITIDPTTQDLKFKDLSSEKNYYDKKFEEIENNEVLYEYHQKLTEILKKIRSNFPIEFQDKIDFNSIIAVKKSMTEILLESGTFYDKFSKIAAHFWQMIKDMFSVTPQATFSNLKINPITGELDHKINADFINANANKIRLITTVNGRELAQAFGIDKIGNFDQIQEHTPAIQKTIDYLNNQKSILNNKLKTASTKASRKNLIARIASLDNQLNKIITFDTLETNYKAVEALSNILGTDANAKAIKARLKGKNTNLKNLIKKSAVDQTAQEHSFDLPKVMKMYLDLSAKYQAREKAKPIIDLLKSVYKNIQTPKTQNTGKKLRASDRNNNGKVILEGVRTEAIAQWNDWYARVVLQQQGITHSGILDSMNVSEKSKIRQFFEKMNTSSFVSNIFTKKNYQNKVLTKTEKEIYDKIEKLIKNEKNPKEKAKLIKQRDKLGKYLSLTGMFNGLLNFTRFKGLGWNPLSAITNMMEGEISNLTVMSLGLVDENEYWEANAIVRKSFAKNLTPEKLKHPFLADARKLRILNDKMQIIQDSANELQKASVKSSYSRAATVLQPYELNKRTEYMIQSKIIVAKLKMQKITDNKGNESSVWDALDEHGKLKPQFRVGKTGSENIKNWEEMTGKDYLDLAGTTESIINLAHGNYSELRGMMVKSNILGKALLMFKTWAPMAMASRFAVSQPNLLLGMKEFKGRWRSFTGTGAALFGGTLGFASLMPFLPFGFVPSMLIAAGSGAIIGNKAMSKLTRSAIKTEMTTVQELLFATKMLAMKFVGMPVNRIYGREVSWVKKYTGDYTDYVKGDSFTETDAKNMNANITNIALTVQRLMLMLAVKAMAYGFDDEEEERPEYNFTMNKLEQINNNIQTFIPFSKEFWKMGSFTELPVMRTYNQLLDEAEAILNYIAGQDLELSGPNTRQSKLWNQTKKTFIPALNSYEQTISKQFEEDPYEKLFISEWKKQRDEILRDKQIFIAEQIENGMPPGQAKKLANKVFAHLKHFQNPNKARKKWEEDNLPVN